jgi:hypothetical protein
MADELTPNIDTPTTQAAPATQPTAPATLALTQADVDAAVQRAKDATWAEARRTFEGKQKQSGGGQPQQPKNEQPATPTPTVDVRAEINRIRAFERAAGVYGLSSDALGILEDDFNSANPQDPAAWVAKRASAFGWKPAGGGTNPATPAPAPAPQVTSTGAPVSGGGAPSNPTKVTDDTPILRMSDEDREALRRRIGDFAYVDRMKKEFREHGTRVSFRRT